ncbi:MAG: efflux RND transporter periplasmic adaptor subunit [Proteobacteria bacterium]|nr:efflux RND transporter periplasmic adaptor subunit [Pseudomonadota bacterium]MBU1057146.1 efflux RND transporter periplasmic adaptor subunit [Pseudomonadota bacterium]
MNIPFVLIFLSFLLFPGSGFSGDIFETFLEPNQVVDMGSSYRDRLAVLHVKAGERVQVGQLLAEFDSQVLQSRLDLAKTAAAFHGSIDSAQALVTLRRSKLAALEKLHQSGNARPQELDTVRTNLAMAEAQLLDAYESRKLKEAEQAVIAAQLEEKKLYSPLDGVVLKIYKQEAELVGTSEEESILTLVQLDPLLAVFHLSSTSLPAIQVGESALLVVAGKQVRAEVDFISPVIEAQSGTVAIRFRLPNQDGLLVSGSRVTYTPSQQQENQNNVTGKQE